MVNRSISLILHYSVTSSNSEEAIAVLGVKGLHLVWLDGEFGGDLVLFSFGFEPVENSLLLYLSILEEHVESRLANWDNLF